LAFWWIAVACLHIKSTLLNHTCTGQKTAILCPDDDDDVYL